MGTRYKSTGEVLRISNRSIFFLVEIRQISLGIHFFIYITPNMRSIQILFPLFLCEKIRCGYTMEVPCQWANTKYLQNRYCKHFNNALLMNTHNISKTCYWY